MRVHRALDLLDDATLADNLAGIRNQLSRLLDFDDADTGALMTNNADWTKGVSYLEFLRDIGKYLTINYMMAKDSVKSRLEGDERHQLHRVLVHAAAGVRLRAPREGPRCRLQVGGNDQYGNITAGCELSRKMGGPQLFGLTAPLLLDSRGEKMGKTSTGERIWLDAERTPPFEFYQYWFNRQRRRSAALPPAVLAAPARRDRRAARARTTPTAPSASRNASSRAR